MEYLNRILLDCLWGTCSSSFRHPRVAQCTRKLAQVTTPVACILYVPGSNFGRDVSSHNRKLLRVGPFPPECRHATTTRFLSYLQRILHFIAHCRRTLSCASVDPALSVNEFLSFIANICMLRLLYRSHHQAKNKMCSAHPLCHIPSPKW
jgi:hypothetical protein